MDTFDSLRCFSRFVRIEQFRKDAQLDCLLMICGSDGRFHRGSDLLRRYLLCGESGRDLALGTTERFDEVVIAFRADKTVAFCQLSEAKAFSQITAMWPGLELIVPPGIPEDDAYDIAKIRTFVGMMENIAGTVGVLGEDVEKYPLIQAFALDEWPGSQRGFLSSCVEKVVRVDTLLEMVYSQMDREGLDRLLGKLKSFEDLWESAMKIQDFARLMEYYEYGVMQDIDVEDGFPVRTEYASEPRRRVEPKKTPCSYTACDPATQVIVARTVPQLALTEDGNGKVDDPSDVEALRQLVQEFDLNPFEGNVEAMLKERWKGSNGDKLEIKIDRYDGAGFRIPPRSMNIKDPMNVLEKESGTVLVTVFAQMGKNCWGDSFIVNNPTKRAGFLKLIPLTIHYASLFQSTGELSTEDDPPPGHESIMRWGGFEAPGYLDPEYDPHNPGFKFTLRKGPSFTITLDAVKGYVAEKVVNSSPPTNNVVPSAAAAGEREHMWAQFSLNNIMVEVLITLKDLRGWPKLTRFEPEASTESKNSEKCTWEDLRQTVTFSDLHFDQMPPKSRRAGFDQGVAAKNTTLWVTSPIGSNRCLELCTRLAEKCELGHVTSLRELAFPQSGDREIDLTSVSAPTGVVCNNIGAPVVPPINAFVICDMRAPDLCSPHRYRWHTWPLHCIDQGFCDLCILPPYVHGATSTDEWETHEDMENVIELIKARNPSCSIIRPYTVDPATIQEAMDKCDYNRTRLRLSSRPGFLDDESGLPGSLRCISFMDKKCYDEEKMKFELPTIFLKLPSLACIEVKVDAFGGPFHKVITPHEILDTVQAWDGITFWVYGKTPEAEDIARDALKKCEKVLHRAEVEEVTSEEMAELLTARGLPGDWWFDGTMYINYLGQRSSKHPLYDEVYREALEANTQACFQKNEELDRIRVMKGIDGE